MTRECTICGSAETYITPDGYEQWHTIDDEDPICRDCYKELYKRAKKDLTEILRQMPPEQLLERVEEDG